jgi:hypothetical protein
MNVATLRRSVSRLFGRIRRARIDDASQSTAHTPFSARFTVSVSPSSWVIADLPVDPLPLTMAMDLAGWTFTFMSRFQPSRSSSAAVRGKWKNPNVLLSHPRKPSSARSVESAAPPKSTSAGRFPPEGSSTKAGAPGASSSTRDENCCPQSVTGAAGSGVRVAGAGAGAS